MHARDNACHSRYTLSQFLLYSVAGFSFTAEAMKNYFRSKRQDASRKRDQHREKMRKYERKNQVNKCLALSTN